ncbi:TIM44-like domain-containing protein [Bradyrhizobium sp. LHD-71]|nr:TIM44-like domain-containing protein [Bradyrhizobium sp. LHD-71]MDQ8732754.1 TIM44-like domain-containing protein [Bradyrhizobium sp. LHD-71]
MMSSKRIRASFKAFAVVMALALPTAIAISSVADARVGRGGSAGSRGSNTFSAPPATKTAPGSAQPIQRSQAQPTAPTTAPQTTGGLFNRPGMGMLGGLAAGFLGAGLLGMLFGGGLFGGLGGLASFLGLLLQVGLIALVAMFALRWWRSRNAPSYASGPANIDAGRSPQQDRPAPQGGGFGGLGGGLAGTGAGAAAPVARGPIKITPDDYDAFERLLGDVQTAWSNEDKTTLARLTTPEMEQYFTADLADNAAKGLVNKVTDVKLLQGDLAEAWHEGSDDYATVAMRFALVDKTIEHATGRVVEGSDQPTEATELWTFVRPKNADWMLSAIQQTH